MESQKDQWIVATVLFKSFRAVFDLPSMIQCMPGNPADEVARCPSQPSTWSAHRQFAVCGGGQAFQNRTASPSQFRCRDGGCILLERPTDLRQIRRVRLENVSDDLIQFAAAPAWTFAECFLSRSPHRPVEHAPAGFQDRLGSPEQIGIHGFGVGFGRGPGRPEIGRCVSLQSFDHREGGIIRGRVEFQLRRFNGTRVASSILDQRPDRRFLISSGPGPSRPVYRSGENPLLADLEIYLDFICRRHYSLSFHFWKSSRSNRLMLAGRQEYWFLGNLYMTKDHFTIDRTNQHTVNYT